MKEIKIYIQIKEKVSSQRMEVFSEILLRQDEQIKKNTQTYRNKTSDYVMIIGIAKCLKMLKEPYSIKVYLKTAFPLKRMRKVMKGNRTVKNADILRDLIDLAMREKHAIEFFLDPKAVQEAFNQEYLDNARKIIKTSSQFVFMDFEMLTGRRSNIISIGAVKRDIALQYQGSFERIIKPRGKYRVENLCYELTGIKKERIEREGIDFNLAMDKFLRWVGDIDNACFLTWGDFDYTRLLKDAKELRNDKLQNLLSRMIDFQRFIQFKHQLSKQVSLLDMGGFYNLQNCDHHQALSDARYLSKIYCAYRMQKDKQQLIKFGLRNKIS